MLEGLSPEFIQVTWSCPTLCLPSLPSPESIRRKTPNLEEPYQHTSSMLERLSPEFIQVHLLI
jgi:hypothetical protein